MLPAGQVVHGGLRAFERGKHFYIPGLGNHIQVLLPRFFTRATTLPGQPAVPVKTGSKVNGLVLGVVLGILVLAIILAVLVVVYLTANL